MNPFQNFVSSISANKQASPFAGAPKSTASFLPQKKTTPQVPNSPAAVGTNTAAITPNSTARNAYTSSISNQNTGLSEQDVRSNLTKFNATNTAQTGSTAQPGSTAEQPATKETAFLKSWRDNLSQYSTAVKPSADYEAAALSAADIHSKIEERKTKGQQNYEEMLNRSGVYKNAAEDEASIYARKENADLANLSVQGSAADRRLMALTGVRDSNISAAKLQMDASKPIQIGNDYYDPTTGEKISTTEKTPEGFSLSAGETRFDGQGNPIASGGAKPMSAAQEAQSIKEQEATKQAEQQATQSLGLINSLLAGDVSKITGAGQNPLNYAGLSNSKALNEYDQLQALLKLGIRGLIKGQGAVSDYEGRILASGASKLGRNLKNEDFKQALKDIRGAIKTNNGQSTQVVITDPSDGSSEIIEATGDGIYKAVSDGMTVIYL